MKVIVQIPCLNEEKTLPLVLKGIPKKIPGVDKVEILVADDGSSDKTIKVARAHGVQHIHRQTTRQGLGRNFHDASFKALQLGADIVVNTDGDNQYPSERIADLVQPIIKGQADIVIGDRQTQTIEHFSPFKKWLQRVGSKVVNIAAGTDVPDAASGFRAYSRESLIKINLITRFSYTMETIIQAGNKHLAIASIPIKTNPKTRESRLFKSNFEHVTKSAAAITRAYLMYRPNAIFVTTGTLFLVAGLIPFIRFFYFFFLDIKRGVGVHHLQSLIMGAVLLIAAVIAYALGIIADLIRINRTLIEDELEHTKRIRLGE